MTTRRSAVERLRRGGQAAGLDDVRPVRDDDFVTSAGVSAGIDVALWLVGEMARDPAFARAAQKGIECCPTPPYTAVARAGRSGIPPGPGHAVDPADVRRASAGSVPAAGRAKRAPWPRDRRGIADAIRPVPRAAGCHARAAPGVRRRGGPTHGAVAPTARGTPPAPLVRGLTRGVTGSARRAPRGGGRGVPRPGRSAWPRAGPAERPIGGRHGPVEDPAF